MADFREVKLPSGATLKIAPAKFKYAKDLYQSILAEVKLTTITSKDEWASALKDLLCAGFSSKTVEGHIWKCLEKCTMDGEKITEDSFEPVERRDDFMLVCMEALKENIYPFVKSLYAEWRQAMGLVVSTTAATLQ